MKKKKKKKRKKDPFKLNVKSFLISFNFLYKTATSSANGKAFFLLLLYLKKNEWKLALRYKQTLISS